jgi:quercetin dioxygenase-like cupin family protein
VDSILTAMDVNQLAKDLGVTMVPSSLADCARARPDVYQGEPSPLAIAKRNANELVDGEPSSDVHVYAHQYFIDAKTVPWIINPDLPDIGLKILRVSEETGVISLIVKHKGIATPHTHIGAADFLVLSGAIGYRAGPPEGYGAGMWFYEPAGARHESTQSLTDEPLIYTANVYGPLIFDSGKGTPVEAVLSWVEYVALAEGGGAKLVPNSEGAERALLAWSALKS